MKKHFTAHLFFAATAFASQPVWALGFGRAVSDAVLGQGLTFTVAVRVDDNERFGADCVSADVYYGESRLEPRTIRTSVAPGSSETEWLVKVTAFPAISEPLVEVALSAGCERRFVRRFTVFADPPGLAAPAVVLAPMVAAAQVAGPASAPRTAGDSPRGAQPGGAVRAPRRAASAAQTGRPHVLRKGPTMALANELGAPSAARRGVDGAGARRPGPAASAAGDTSRLVLDTGYSHLKLDMEDPIIPAATAASGASVGLTDLDDPDARQLHALEQSIQAVRRDSLAARDQAARLRTELADAQQRSGWLPYSIGLLAIALAAIGALLWKLREQSRLTHGAWFAESQLGLVSRQDPEPAPAPVPAAPATPEPVPEERTPNGARVVGEPMRAFLSDAPIVRALHEHSATQPLDRSALAGLLAQEAPAPRELSVEELLDLEQQADFFIALGQEDAAVDLLMSHLRSAGGQSPLPYTKLLEIYRRQGDRSAYERTRARFNRRFNAYAPDWDTGPTAGRTLEDYPETVARVQAVWSAPIDAMAVLEGLLFKRDDSSELFDLPAYRDVLVLYSLARDLWQQGGGTPGAQVDVLLPLDEPDSGGWAAPEPYPSARQVNDLEQLLDADEDDEPLASREGMLTSFEMTGFEPGARSADLDLEIPHLADSYAGEDEGHAIHATLDALSLAPIDPAQPGSMEWDGGVREPDDPQAPKKR